MNKKGNFGKLVLGLGAGIGLGMLFAPDKGSETRKKVKAKLEDLINEIKNLDQDEVKMTIEEKDFQLIPIDESSGSFDLKLLYKIQPRGRGTIIHVR